MGKRIVLLILICLLPLDCFGFGVFMGGGGAVESEGGYSDIMLYANFENTPTANKSSYADQVFSTYSTSFDIVDSPKDTYWVDCAEASNYMVLDMATGEPDTASGRIGFYLMITSGSDGQVVFTFQSDASNLLRIRLDGGNGRHLEMWYEANGDDAFFSTNGTFELVADTIYFVELKYDQPNNSFAIIVDGDTKATGTMDNASNTWVGDPSILKLGLTTTQSADIHLDSLLISNNPDRDLNAIRSLNSYPD